MTNSLFREQILGVGGADVVATEFLRITGERQGVSPIERHESVPLQIQLMSPHALTLVHCIEHLYQNDILRRDDWLDLNVGCPSKRVNSRGAGAALLKDPEQLLAIISAVREVHPGVLSVKTRVGFDSDENYTELLKVLSCAPLDFITIHARTRCDAYSQPANWNYLAKAVNTLPYPVIGNGDVFSAQQAALLRDSTHVRGVMCGRGVLINPFLLRDIQDGRLTPEPQERRAELIDFFFSLLSRYQARERRSGRRLTGPVKEFCVWFSRNEFLPGGLFTLAKRARSLDEIAEIAEIFFTSHRETPAGTNVPIRTIPESFEYHLT
ncbi:MAG: tRNA-dihydrouridine synthase family protein [Bdellovibrionales bacterium]|nr:tRNA-dihydrouridine synthase family protein [Bdellovibrionales bacterium]